MTFEVGYLLLILFFYKLLARRGFVLTLAEEDAAVFKTRSTATSEAYLREHSSLDKGQVEYALRNLTTAGWIKQVNKGGLYEFVADPRR